MSVKPFNPLDKGNIAASIVQELLSREPTQLPRPRGRGMTGDVRPFEGAGIYAIYYIGEFELYAAQAARNRSAEASIPIYIGKADPRGGRRGDIEMDASVGTSLFDRLRDHATSIHQADNLELRDFACRYLAVDEVWIGLAERLAIRQYLPTWNTLVDGFGIHDPGGGRQKQAKSDWDVLHPGRRFAANLPPGRSLDAIVADIAERHSKAELAKRAAEIASSEDGSLPDRRQQT